MGYRDLSVGEQGTSFASQPPDLSVSIVTSQPGVARRALIRVLLQLALVAVLVVLAALNISSRGWTEQDDGVLWESNGNDVIASVVAEGSPAARAGIRPGDSVAAGRGAPGLVAEGRPRGAPRRAVNRRPALRRHSQRRRRRRGHAPRRRLGPAERAHWLYFALAGGRHLHAARRRRRAAAPPREPGDAALLLAVDRVLRRAGVLVQRPPRSRSTGCSTGPTSWRCCCCRRSSCTSRWCSRNGPTAGPGATRAATCCRWSICPALLLGGAQGRGVMRGDRKATCCRACCSSSTAPSCSTSRLCLVGGFVIMTRALCRVRSVTARRQLRWIVWGTALGAVPFVLGYALPFALGFAPSAWLRADGGAARPRAARVRLGDHPLPPDGRRGHHQARAGLRRGDRRDRRDLRHPAAARRASSSRPTRRAASEHRSSRCWRRWSSCCWRGR